jgi:hypothetical protein
VNYELERILKEKVVTTITVLSQHFPEWNEENHQQLNQNSTFPDSESNQKYLE